MYVTNNARLFLASNKSSDTSRMSNVFRLNEVHITQIHRVVEFSQLVKG